MELAAKALKIQIQFLDARSPKDAETAFREATKRHVDAVLVTTSPIVASQRAQIADLAVKNRLPAIYGQPEYVDVGGLMFTAPALLTCSGVPQHTSIKYSKAKRPQIYRWSSRRSSSSSSI